MEEIFYYRNNRLHCDGIDLQEFSRSKKTPFYLYSQKRIEQNCQTVIEAGKDLDFLPCYALKANYNPAVLKLIQNLGFGADVVSGGELFFALRAGFPPQKIVFAGVGKTASEIELAIRTGIHSLNIESAEEFYLTREIAGKLKIETPVAFRINPDIGAPTHDYIATGKHLNKFGIPLNEALRLYQQAFEDKWLKPVGIHVHIGSQITDPKPFLETAEYLKDIIDQLRKKEFEISALDLGGGIGIDYYNDFKKQQSEYPLKTILPSYLRAFKDLGVKLVVELGRSIVGDAGLLITRVLYRKQTPVKKFLIVDAAMNNLLRPSLYHAYHSIVPLILNDNAKDRFDVVGPVCESGDFLANDRELQLTERGDLLAVGGAGAYGQVLASNYNLRPSIPEYLVSGKEVRTIFKGQTAEELAQKYDW